MNAHPKRPLDPEDTPYEVFVKGQYVTAYPSLVMAVAKATSLADDYGCEVWIYEWVPKRHLRRPVRTVKPWTPENGTWVAPGCFLIS